MKSIPSILITNRYTDTVLKFSDMIWWTLARDTNSDNIVEVILPEVSVAEGLIFVEEVYSSIHSLKALNPNALTIIILNI